jgi:hypothetical protein
MRACLGCKRSWVQIPPARPPADSDHADKPYTATISWVSTEQDSKIYSEREKAEKATEWLELGKIAGAKANVKRGTQTFKATLSFGSDKWTLESLDWYGNLPPGVRNVPADARRGASTKNGDKHPWWDALKEVAVE